MVLALAGVALLLGSVSPWFVVPVFIGVISYNVIPVEESMLAERFGQEYLDYRARVRRWI
jgi:protein-S-isoprenylcysteine O-methyltransferase Ste14